VITDRINITHNIIEKHYDNATKTNKWREERMISNTFSYPPEVPFSTELFATGAKTRLVRGGVTVV